MKNNLTMRKGKKKGFIATKFRNKPVKVEWYDKKDTKKKVVKAWAVVFQTGNILMVCQCHAGQWNPAIFRTKRNALSSAKIMNGKVVPVTITYEI